MLCRLQSLITVVPKFVILYVCTVLSRIHLILHGLCNVVTFTMQDMFSALSHVPFLFQAGRVPVSLCHFNQCLIQVYQN